MVNRQTFLVVMASIVLLGGMADVPVLAETVGGDVAGTPRQVGRESFGFTVDLWLATCRTRSTWQRSSPR